MSKSFVLQKSNIRQEHHTAYIHLHLLMNQTTSDWIIEMTRSKVYLHENKKKIDLLKCAAGLYQQQQRQRQQRATKCVEQLSTQPIP